MNLYCKSCNCIARERAGKIVVKKKICIAIPFLYCREEGLRVGRVLQYTGLYCRKEGCGIVLQDGCIGLELYCNTVIVLKAGRLGWLDVSQYSKSVL